MYNLICIGLLLFRDHELYVPIDERTFMPYSVATKSREISEPPLRSSS